MSRRKITVDDQNYQYVIGKKTICVWDSDGDKIIAALMPQYQWFVIYRNWDSATGWTAKEFVEEQAAQEFAASVTNDHIVRVKRAITPKYIKELIEGRRDYILKNAPPGDATTLGN